MTERNYFKEKLYHHTLPVNEGLWGAIEASLPPEQKQKRFPVFWMTLFGTTLLGGALMIGVFTPNTTTTPSSPPSVKNEVMASATTTAATSTAIDATTGTSDDLETIETTSTNSSATTAPTASTSANQTGSKAKSSIANKSSNTNQSKANKNTTGKSNQKANITKASSSLIPEINTISEDDLSVDAEVYMAGAKLPYRNTSMTSLLPLAEMNQSTATMNLMSAIAPDPNCYKFGDIGAHYALSVDGIFGIGFSPKSLEQNGGETADYISARKATESNQYAWSLGARLNLHHRSGFTGRLGFQYTQTGDLFDYADSLATQSTTRIDSFFAADGTFLYTEVNQVFIDGTLVKKIHNTYRYLDIPLLVGYEMRLGRNIVMLNTGPVFNLTHTYEGQILDSMLHPRSITPGTPGAIDIYKTNVGMSIYLGAGILFPLTDELSALIEPSYLFRLNPVSLNSYELKEKRGFASLNLGIRYHIN